MRLYSEGGENKIAQSQHFHRFCNIQNTKLLKANPMKVCSNITDIVAQVLLGTAIGPKRKLLHKIRQQQQQQRQQKAVPDTSSSLTYCYSCPKSLMPFRIIPYPQMTCVKGPLKKASTSTMGRKSSNKESSVVTTTTSCPANCLARNITMSFRSESDVVNVRYCPA